MKQILKKTDKAIITKNPVKKSYDNEDCFLYAQIEHVRTEADRQMEVYKVRTDLAKYINFKRVVYTEVEPVVDTTTEPTETIEPVIPIAPEVTSTIISEDKLTWVEQLQDWAIQEIPFNKILEFDAVLDAVIPTDLDRITRNALELKTMFLMQRQNDAPWGVEANEWRISNEDDLIKLQE